MTPWSSGSTGRTSAWDVWKYSLARAIDDLGMLTGARAGDVAGKEAGLIARDVGLHYRASLTGTELASLSDAVDTTGIAANELRSFHRADLIFEATDREGDLQYVAVEASWTVNGRDTVRAIRNAWLLATFTGPPQPRGGSGSAPGRPYSAQSRCGRGVLVRTDPGVHARA